MRKFLQKLRQDCRGAVTVFVALMLVPSVLVSGTGVDLARLYVARSEIQDANQLAANSALASYDALLQDLYGLFGIVKDDGELASMMEQYIGIALFGESWKDCSLGTFSHFYAEPSSLTVTAEAADGKNLENVDVLRRQIEEYVKFRAPVIIAQEVLGKLDSFEKITENAAVIHDKMEVDDKLEELDEVYKKLYDCIQKINKARDLENGAIESVNTHINRMEGHIEELYETREDYTEEATKDEETDGPISQDLLDAYEDKYEGLFDNLHNEVTGGKIQQNYSISQEKFTFSYDTDGLEDSIHQRSKELEDFISNGTWADDSLEELVDLARKADERRAELADLLNDMQERLDSGKCSEDFKKGLTETKQENGKTIMEEYQDIVSVNYDIELMAQTMKNQDESQLNSTIELLQGVGYGNGSSLFLTLDQIKQINEHQSGYEINLETQESYTSSADKLLKLYNIKPKNYVLSSEFVLFQEVSTESSKFYGVLCTWYNNYSEENVSKKDITNAIGKLTGAIQEQFAGFLQFDPLGAWSYTQGSDESSGSNSTSFGTGGGWDDSDTAKEQTKNALNDNFLSRLSNAGNDAVDKLLLLTYDSEMFSCYVTSDGYSGSNSSEETEENMAGIPLGIKVNYYFQSELEYLYNGNLNDAKANLAAVTGMLFLIRFVLDYTASFSISSVNSTVNTVENSLPFLGPGAIVVGELVRLVLALGEGVMDLTRLKNGNKVTLFKSSDTEWKFSISALLTQIAEGVVGDLSDSDFKTDDGDDDTGLVYKDYMRLFLLLVDGGVLAQRTAKLIELNVTNYKEGIGNSGDRSAREQAMSAAELFDMSKAVTDFSVTTSVNLKMLFLSSPIAQSGYANGVVPPTTKELVVTDYRGY